MNFWRLFILLAALAITIDLPAQLCQGSLGNPLVNITFGSGSNPGPSLNAASTSYQYITADCPNDGFYAVRNRTDRCFGNWHSLSSDHTGDANGYFMLVNASFAPGAFYIDTVELACSNTTYEFAAWVMNMNSPTECSGSPIRPNLTFTIEETNGAILQSYNTGDIQPQTTAVWRQVGFFFTTPSFVNRVVLKIRNNAAGGCGNDLALDDITFRPCGPKLNVMVNSGGNMVNLCEGTAGQVTFTGSVSAGFDNPFLQWQRSIDNGQTWNDIAGANDKTLTQSFPESTPVGVYQYRMAASKVENRLVVGCQVFSESLTVKINAKPTILAQALTPMCEYQTLVLTANGGIRYSWRGAGGFSAAGSPVSLLNARPSQAGWYFVTGFSDAGCQQVDSINVVIHETPRVVTNGDELAICEGEAVELLASGGDNYAWSPATGLTSTMIANPLASPTDSTQYKVVVTNQHGCSDSGAVLVKVYRKPTADAGLDRDIGQGQSTVLDGAATGTSVRYLWSPPVAIDDATRLWPTVSPAQSQTYVLTVTSPLGCGEAIDSARVTVFKGIFIPTAFTPNSDGKNDVWRIVGLTIYPSYEILVFNRYGQVVYRSKNAAKGWDGTFNGQRMPIGSYPYLLKVDGGKKIFKGLLTLIR